MNVGGVNGEQMGRIMMFPDAKVIDFCGPYEVFSVTRLDEEQRREEMDEIPRIPGSVFVDCSEGRSA
jgi:hypothetical protein